jgi:hypothetical protein
MAPYYTMAKADAPLSQFANPKDHRMSQPAKVCHAAELPISGRVAAEMKAKTVPHLKAGCTRPRVVRS